MPTRSGRRSGAPRTPHWRSMRFPTLVAAHREAGQSIAPSVERTLPLPDPPSAMVSVYRGATCEAEPSGAVEPQAETNAAIVAATSGRTIPPGRAQRELGSAMGTRQAEQALEEGVARRPSCVESRNLLGNRGLMARAMKESAGTLLYRRRAGCFEVLIIKPGGFAARYGWSIPKGLVEPGEDPEAAARPETREETGVDPGPLELLGCIEYTKSRKRIHCFFGHAPEREPTRIRDFEVAEARFVEKDDARRGDSV